MFLKPLAAGKQSPLRHCRNASDEDSGNDEGEQAKIGLRFDAHQSQA
jgi:hypothetical protein